MSGNAYCDSEKHLCGAIHLCDCPCHQDSGLNPEAAAEYAETHPDQDIVSALAEREAQALLIDGAQVHFVGYGMMLPDGRIRLILDHDTGETKFDGEPVWDGDVMWTGDMKYDSLVNAVLTKVEEVFENNNKN
jgi:hypothetical protein